MGTSDDTFDAAAQDVQRLYDVARTASLTAEWIDKLDAARTAVLQALQVGKSHVLTVLHEHDKLVKLTADHSRLSQQYRALQTEVQTMRTSRDSTSDELSAPSGVRLQQGKMWVLLKGRADVVTFDADQPMFGQMLDALQTGKRLAVVSIAGQSHVVPSANIDAVSFRFEGAQ